MLSFIMDNRQHTLYIIVSLQLEPKLTQREGDTQVIHLFVTHSEQAHFVELSVWLLFVCKFYAENPQTWSFCQNFVCFKLKLYKTLNV